ncbi:hypothetical protein ACFX5K_01200 [Rickettsiales bacterium LUAb2]
MKGIILFILSFILFIAVLHGVSIRINNTKYTLKINLFDGYLIQINKETNNANK